MKNVLRISALWEYLKGALWVLPTVFVIAAVLAGTLLAEVRIDRDSPLHGWVFGGTADSARQMLSIIAGAMMTVAALTFSMTVLALQMASAQYSPRVLRGFLTDRGNQVVLSVFLATFAYALAVIRVTRGDGAIGGSALPRLAVSVSFLLMLAAMAALVYFLHHLTQQLRIETIMREVVDETHETIAAMHSVDETGTDAIPQVPPDEPLTPLRALRSGYLQAVDAGGMASMAQEQGIKVRLRIPVGTYTPEDTTVAWAWSANGSAITTDRKALTRAVHHHLHLGRERTMQQDVAFGLRQLADIAGKALSPGINDPTTAVEALAYLSRLVCDLAQRELGAQLQMDDHEAVRVIVPRPTFADYLHLAVDQPRRYGKSDPAVMRAILSLLADVAERPLSAQRRDAVQAEVARTLEVASKALDATDMTKVQAGADEVIATLEHGRQPISHVAAG